LAALSSTPPIKAKESIKMGTAMRKGKEMIKNLEEPKIRKGFGGKTQNLMQI